MLLGPMMIVCCCRSVQLASIEPAATSLPSTFPATAAAGPESLRRSVLLTGSQYPEGITDEAAYGSYLEDQADKIARRLESQSTLSRRVELLLALCNWKLARQAEPFASRLLLDIASRRDRTRLAQLSRSAVSDIQVARELLKQLEAAPAALVPAETMADWERTLSILAPVAKIMAALAEADEQGAPADELKHQWLGAASDLAAALEDPRAEVAAAARLWQAVALRLGGRADRALKVLAPALSPLRAPRYDFFSRLERCRAVAAEEMYVAPIASAIRIGHQCGEWFKDQATTADARRAAALIQIELCHRRVEKLTQEGHVREAADTQRLIAAIRTNQFPTREPPDQRPTVFRLGTVVPLLAIAPSRPPATAAATTSVPASAPTTGPTTAATQPGGQTH